MQLDGQFANERFTGESPAHDPDEKLINISAHIYNLYELGLLDFDVAEQSLSTISSLCENTWLGMPEPE